MCVVCVCLEIYIYIYINVCVAVREVRRTQFILSARGRDIFLILQTGRAHDSDGRDFGTAVNNPECQRRVGDRAISWMLPLLGEHSGKFWARWLHEGRKRGTDNFTTTTTGSGLRLRVRPVASARCRLAIGPLAGSSIRVFYRTGVPCARQRARNKRARSREIDKSAGAAAASLFSFSDEMSTKRFKEIV